MSFELDKHCITQPICASEELGIYGIGDLHSFIAAHKLYVDPSKSLVEQINSYKSLTNSINIRNMRDLRYLDDRLLVSSINQDTLNEEIMSRTLRK